MHRIVVDMMTKQQLVKQFHEQDSTLNFTQLSQHLAAGVVKTLHSEILVPSGPPVCISGHDPRVNVMSASFIDLIVKSLESVCRLQFEHRHTFIFSPSGPQLCQSALRNSIFSEDKRILKNKVVRRVAAIMRVALQGEGSPHAVLLDLGHHRKRVASVS